VAEGARLESVYTFARIEGSNPSLTAKFERTALQSSEERLNSKGIELFCCLPQRSAILPNRWYSVGIKVGMG
jgi:hypothetical protein